MWLDHMVAFHFIYWDIYVFVYVCAWNCDCSESSLLTQAALQPPSRLPGWHRLTRHHTAISWGPVRRTAHVPCADQHACSDPPPLPRPLTWRGIWRSKWGLKRKKKTPSKIMIKFKNLNKIRLRDEFNIVDFLKGVHPRIHTTRYLNVCKGIYCLQTINVSDLCDSLISSIEIFRFDSTKQMTCCYFDLISGFMI